MAWGLDVAKLKRHILHGMQGDLKVQALRYGFVVRVEDRLVFVKGDQAGGVVGSFRVLQMDDVSDRKPVGIGQLASFDGDQALFGPFLKGLVGGDPYGSGFSHLHVAYGVDEFRQHEPWQAGEGHGCIGRGFSELPTVIKPALVANRYKFSVVVLHQSNSLL